MCAALNPMAAAFGISGGAVAAAAAAAAVAVFGDPRNISNPSGGGGGGGGGAMMGGALLAGTNNLLVNLNSASYSYSLHNNPATSATASSSSCDYHTDRGEWMNRIESAHIDRTLMNKLVMNYLVTGKMSDFQIKIRTLRTLFTKKK